MDRFRLDGSVALVTGASSGIGRRCAGALASAGARVVVVARRLDRLESVVKDLDGAMAVRCDLAVPGAAEELVGRVVAVTGRLDVLVNAAGRASSRAAARETATNMAAVLYLNTIVPFLLAKAAAPVMSSGGGGSIINITSTAVVKTEPGIPVASYAASKGGLATLTRDLAVQWGAQGIRVNALAPGWFPTELNEGFTGAERAAAFTKRIPLGRFGELHEIDGPLLLLASSAGAYITGQTLLVDGGMTAT